MAKKATIEISNKLEELERLSVFFEEYGSANGLLPKFINTFQIIFDELLSNTINYGFNEEKNGFIRLDFDLGKVYLKVVITDNAKPFDPTAESNPDLNSEIEDRKIGGLGIHIVKKMVDVFEYKYQNNLNIITLKKKLIK